MRAAGLLLTALMLTVSFAGCIGALGSNQGLEADGLVRTVRFTFDDETIHALDGVNDPEAFFAAASKTFFTYTHEGADVASEAVIARFVDDGGRDVEKPLSAFTGMPTLSEGDVVTITGAAPYSAMSLRHGALVLAERRHVVADWFEVDGMPLPLAAAPGSSAAWRFSGDADIEIGFDKAGYEATHTYSSFECDVECYETPRQEYDAATVEDALFGLAADTSGTIALSSLNAGTSTHLDVAFDGRFSLGSSFDALLSVFTESPGNKSAEDSGPLGYDVSLSAQGKGMARMVFASSGLLTATGAEGSFSTAGSGTIWYPGHPKETAPDVFAGEEMPAETFTYREYPYHGGDLVPSLVADLVADIYGITLVPGDAFEIVVAYGDDDVDVDMRVEILVAARETKQVAAGAMPTLRIETSFSMAATPAGASPNSMSFKGMTHWIHEDSYLPVLVQLQAPGDWPSDDDVNDILDLASQFASDGSTHVTLPTSFHTSVSAESRMELTSNVGRVRVPAIMSLLGLWGASVFPASIGMAGVSPGYDVDEMPRPAPAMSFERREASVLVVAAGHDEDWSNIIVDVEGDCAASLVQGQSGTPITDGGYASNEPTPMRAGDAVRVEGTGDCDMILVHATTYTLLGEWRFQL